MVILHINYHPFQNFALVKKRLFSINIHIFLSLVFLDCTFILLPYLLHTTWLHARIKNYDRFKIIIFQSLVLKICNSRVGNKNKSWSKCHFLSTWWLFALVVINHSSYCYLWHVGESHVIWFPADSNEEGGLETWFVKAREGLPGRQRLELRCRENPVAKQQKHCSCKNISLKGNKTRPRSTLLIHCINDHQGVKAMQERAPSVPPVSVLISVRAVVETIVGVWEHGFKVQRQKTALAHLEVTGELHGNLLSRFVLQHGHILSLSVAELGEGEEDARMNSSEPDAFNETLYHHPTLNVALEIFMSAACSTMRLVSCRTNMLMTTRPVNVVWVRSGLSVRS